MASEKKFKYVPSARAKANPVRLVKKGYAIGGSIDIKPKAPKLPYTVPEATQEQYQEYYEGCNGKTFLVEKKAA